MIFILGGYDTVARIMFPYHVQGMREEGHEVIMLPTQERDVFMRLEDEKAAQCNVAILCPSAFETAEEHKLMDYLRSVNSQIQFIVRSDVPTAEFRIDVQHAQFISAVIVAVRNREYLERVRAYYPSARIYYSGPPPHWGPSYREILEGYWRRPELVKLVGKHSLPKEISIRDVIVVVASGKVYRDNNELYEEVVQAGMEVYGEERFVLGPREHPGEVAQPGEKEIFESLIDKRRKGTFLKVPRLKTNMPGFTHAHYIGTGHVAIFNGAGNENFTIAFARGNGIYRDSVANQQALIAQNIPNGEWYPVVHKGLHLIDAESNGFDRLREALYLSMQPRFIEERRALMEKNFPLPRTWNTALQDVRIIEAVARGEEPNLLEPQDEIRQWIG